MSLEEIYEDLRAPTPVGPDEVCTCTGSPAVKLMAALCYNPVHCTQCNLGVPPESLGMDLDTLRGVAYWRWIYDAIYRLWLDSEDYEPWAQQELCDPRSRVNQLGLRLLEAMNKFRRCYYWLFQNETDSCLQPQTHCPLCGRELSRFEGGFFRQRCCEPCSLLLSARRDIQPGDS